MTLDLVGIKHELQVLMLPKSPRDDRFGDQLMADLEDSGTPNSADYNGTFDDLLEDEEEAVVGDIDIPDLDAGDY